MDLVHGLANQRALYDSLSSQLVEQLHEKLKALGTITCSRLRFLVLLTNASPIISYSTTELKIYQHSLSKNINNQRKFLSSTLRQLKNSQIMRVRECGPTFLTQSS